MKCYLCNVCKCNLISYSSVLIFLFFFYFQVALVKSEVYLTDVLDSICEKMDDYSLYYDPKTKEKSFKRFAPRDNEDFPSLDFNNFQFNPGDGSPLKYAVSCSV